jgi:hypothetical protein
MKLSLWRKVATLALVFTLLLSLLSCGNYNPIKSSALERSAVFKTEDYEVNYELVRHVFMSRIDEFDMGDRTLWEQDESEALWQDAFHTILPEILEIYATFDICLEWGLDPYSKEIDEAIDAYVKADIDGGYIKGQYIEGLGSLDAYKESLKKSASTDAVRRLYYRYSLCLTNLYTYIVENGAEGRVSVTDEELTTYLLGSDYAHVNRLYIPFLNQPGTTFSEKRESAYHTISRLRTKLLLADTYDEMVREAFIYSYSTDGAMVDYDQAEYGLWLGKYTTDTTYNKALYDTIFSIGVGEVSDIIETSTGFYVVYGMERGTSPMEIERLKEGIRDLYVEEKYNQQIKGQVVVLQTQITYRDLFYELSGKRLIEGV